VTKTPTKHAVEPELFDLVIKYAAEIEQGKVRIASPLHRSTAIIAFCQNFFGQFFENQFGLQITKIDQETKAQAVGIRLAQSGKGNGPLRQIIAQFEKLADTWPDVIGSGYGGVPSDIKSFHREYMPRLLDRILTWARTTRDAELIDKATQARAEYHKAITALSI